ncbi:MAG: hypothetical protein E6Q66_04730 [Pedobacter sp.]|nr:MAG: hypothetical protein E6Q66_04730 [Pedobacter sp.]
MLTNKQASNIVLSNGKQIEITLADLSSFLNSCKERGLGLEDFEDIFLDISEAVTDQTHDDALSRDLKIKLFFLRKLNFLFKSMLYRANSASTGFKDA